MTTATDGMELTRVGPGTVMGELMRCYWIPAAMSSELARDGAPLRLMLLGEKLIAFRDSAGRVGVMDHRCPHRCASLFLGRNEEGGIRCIYHGWKFDVAGNCLDMPSLPPPGFKQKVKAKAYKVVERAGVVWVYMGSRAEAPPLPAFEILDVPEDEIKVSFIQRDCNYLQALEGEIDTSHFGFLHAGHVDPGRPGGGRAGPEHRHQPRAGVSSGRNALGHAVRRLPRSRARPDLLALRQLPVSVLDAGAQRRVRQPHACARLGAARRRAHHVLLHLVEARRCRRCRCRSRPSRTARRSAAPGAATSSCPTPPTGSAAGGWRRTPGNDWGIDRAAQQSNTIYSGIDGIHLQDQAITESMGPIVDHALEHLAPSDQMITRTRRRLLMAARALRDKGVLPPGVEDAEVYRGARSGYFVSDDKSPWREVYARQLAASVHPQPSPMRAAE